MRKPLLSLAVLAFALPLAAHADTVDTFTFTGVTTNFNLEPGTVTGTLDIDVTAGNIYGVNATFTSLTQGTFGFTAAPSAGNQQADFFGDGYVAFIDSTVGGSPGDAQIALLLPPLGPLTGYNGGNICSNANPCNSIVSTVYVPAFTLTSTGNEFDDGSLVFLSSRTVDVPSAVPEPSSLALLATGLIGVGGTLRKKLARA
jgi:PEP-CTERM motif